MADDRLRDLVASSAGRPAGDVPMNRILGLARRRRLNRRLTIAAVPLAALLLAGVAVLATMPQARVEFAPPVDQPEDEAEPEPEPEPAEPTPPPEQPQTTPSPTPTEPATEPDEEVTTPASPSPEDDPPGPAPPRAILVTDGQDLELRASVSGEPAWRVEAAGDGEEVLALAVRPGSTAEDLDAVYAVAGEDGFAFGWLAVTGGGEPDLRRDPGGAATVGDDVAPGSEPWPVWSPDGSALAWVELPADETAAGARLRLADWDPEARVATDAAAITLDGLPLQVIRAETWAQALDPAADGELDLYLSSWTLEAWRIGLARGAGGWEVSTPGVLLTGAEAAGAGTPVAIGRDDGPGAAYFLTALDADDGGVVRLDLFDASGHQSLPLDEEFVTADAAGVWIAGGGHHVLVGDGERAWVTSRPGGLQRPVEGAVRHAGWVA